MFKFKLFNGVRMFDIETCAIEGCMENKDRAIRQKLGDDFDAVEVCKKHYLIMIAPINTQWILIKPTFGEQHETN